MRRVQPGLALTLVIVWGCGSTPAEPTTPAVSAATDEQEDPYLWLEDVDSERALAWVRAQNAVSQAELEAAPGFEALTNRLRAVLDSEERIATLQRRGDHFYNFWRDADHPRGLWRRTTLEHYREEPAQWEILLDLDALAQAEDENWVWSYAHCEYPIPERCLIALSRGGADATVVREFDTASRRFVENGFSLPEAKSSVSWVDRDNLYVATDFGEGTLTDSGYPRQVRQWRRGTPLSTASLVLEGQQDDMVVWGSRVHTRGEVHDVLVRRPTFFTEEVHIRRDDSLTRVDKPLDVDLQLWGNYFVFRLRTDWTVEDTTFPGGSLLMADMASYLGGAREFTVLFRPTATTALEDVAFTRNRVIVNVLEDVQSHLYVWTQRDDAWERAAIHPNRAGMQYVSAVDDNESDQYWHWATDFLSPTQYSIGSENDELAPLAQEPSFFDSNGLRWEQRTTQSQDGTRIPYFVIGPAQPAPDAPTLLYGYGGFEISINPRYLRLVGPGWLESGGIYVIANIRGGGEYGARWHQAALRHHRQRAYDDFIAVAEDLIARGDTVPERLGITGRSNGGLLMGVMLTQRPDLFGAIVCGVPLLDMRRFHLLLAGASWVEEYGNPEDPEDWAALSRFSPYHNVRPEVRYPPTLFYSSTRDDRVHPGHARKMVARMQESEQEVRYYENIEGGHGAAANNAQRAYTAALTLTFLRRRLGAPTTEPRAAQ